MDTDEEKFMAINEPKNKLAKVRDSIDLLKNRGYSSPQIMKFLKEYKNISTTARSIDRYYKDVILESKNKIIKIETPIQQEKEVVSSGRDFFKTDFGFNGGMQIPNKQDK